MWLRIPTELLARYAPDNGDGSGPGAVGSGGSSSGTGDGTGGSDGKSGNGDAGDKDIDPDSPAFKAAVKAAATAEVDRVIGERLDRERRNSAAEVERQKQEAAATALKNNQKFEELAATRETQLTEANGKLSTVTAERDTLKADLDIANTAMMAILDAQTKGLPPHITKLLAKMAPADQLTYLAENGAEIRKDATQAVPNHGSNTVTGGNNGGGNSATDGAKLVGTYFETTYGRGQKK